MTTQYFPATATASDIEIRLIKPLKAMIAGTKNGVDVEIKEHKRRRSNDQNRFYWLNMGEIVNVLNEAGATYGEYDLPYTPEIVHEINKRIFGEKTTAKMSVAEFGDYMEKVFGFWIEKTAGFFIPKESPQSYIERTGLIEKQAA